MTERPDRALFPWEVSAAFLARCAADMARIRGTSDGKQSRIPRRLRKARVKSRQLAQLREAVQQLSEEVRGVRWADTDAAFAKRVLQSSGTAPRPLAEKSDDERETLARLRARREETKRRQP